MKGNILIIDDEESIRSVLSQLLTLEDFKIWQAEKAKDGMEILKSEDIHVVISDVRLPDAYGIDLIPQIKEINPSCEIIMLTAYGTIEDGVKAIKSGAFDYLTKGDEDNKIIPLVDKAVEKAKMQFRLNQLENRIREKYNFNNIIGSSELIRDTIEIAKKVAETDVPVLLYGETGTGKEVFAQAIHNAGNRKTKQFVAVNCSAFAKELLESEMFGYKAGAFTGAVKNKKGLFEEAHEGTLFLDEIGEMDLSLQAKILRVIESQSFIKQGDTKPTLVDVRIIAATNRNLEEEIKKGTFRADLFYRINVMSIEIPALRRRKSDIPELARFFIAQYSKTIKKNISEIEDGFFESLMNYDYPGNTRELRNILERAVILCNGSILKAVYLPKEFTSKNQQPINYSSELSLDQVEKEHIKNVLEKTQGNRTKAAELLGIGVTTLYRKLQLYGLE